MVCGIYMRCTTPPPSSLCHTMTLTRHLFHSVSLIFRIIIYAKMRTSFCLVVYSLLIGFYTTKNIVVIAAALSLKDVDRSCGQSGGSSQGTRPQTACISIKQWTDFSTAIAKHASLMAITGTNTTSSSLVFCPFTVKPSASSSSSTTTTTVEISHTISLVCQQEHTCVLDSSKTGGNTLIRIKGPQAKVHFQGFVFQGAGQIYSAVHIVYGVIPTQAFCNCIFQRNMGPTRGTALRTEPNTMTYVMNALFQENKATDMGGIFNRGYLVVEYSLFQMNNGTGAAIATSEASQIELKGNTFTKNNGGYPLYFQGPNFVNAGGNAASNNDQCNGIYDFSARSCIKFPSKSAPRKTPAPVVSHDVRGTPAPHVVDPIKERSKSPSAMPLYNVSSFQHATCEQVNTRNQPCIPVQSWTDFRDKVEDVSTFDRQTLIFCPFTITRGSLVPVVYITSSVDIACAVPRQCRLISNSRHFMIHAFQGAKLYMQGFVLEGAADISVQFLKDNYPNDDPNMHRLCNVEFIRNQGTSRGAALSIEEGNAVIVAECSFQDNKSANVGGAIFNKGAVMLIGNNFINNNGTGSALGSTSGSTVHMAANLFLGNLGRNPIYIENSKVTDMGGNNATGNNGCNGIFVAERSQCVPFNDQMANTSISLGPSPVIVDGDFLTSSVPRSGTTPRGGSGYFNYDPNDYDYGPGVKQKTNQRGAFHFAHNGWANVVGNAEYIRWNELSPTHNRSLANKCSLDSGQSPIDLCEKYINSKCIEHHQTRSHSGNVTFGKQVTAEILPSMLRLKYYRDRTPDGGPYPPEGDFAADWNGYAEVNNINVKIPSEHTVCGKRFPAEYSIFMLHPKRRQSIVMSILMDFDPYDKDNEHFQIALDQWQATFDRSAKKCKNKRRAESEAKRFIPRAPNQSVDNHVSSDTYEAPFDYMKRMTNGYDKHDFSPKEGVQNAISDSDPPFSHSRERTLTDAEKIKTETVLEESESIPGSSEQMRSVYENDDDHLDDHNLLMEQRAYDMRSLITDTSPFGTGGWDPFHPSLKKSIYHWGYWGSLTEPPCATFFAIRVLTKPAHISRKQWNQMRNLLFNYKDENCINTSVDYGESVARPIQDLANRPLYKCTRANYVSDAEKLQIRIDTGNPKWCC